MKTTEFKLRPWPVRVCLVWNCTSRQYRDFIRQRAAGSNFKDPGPFAGFAWSSRKRGLIIIGLDRWRGKTADYQVLTHEVLHATFRVADWVGVKLCDGSEETYTYVAEDLLRRCLEALKR